MLQDFKKFAMQGNVMDMAVGIIIGSAFGKIISSFVSDVLMPPLGLLLGNVNFSNLFIVLGSQTFATLEEAKKAGVPTINYGIFLNTIVDFLLVAFAIFMMIRQLNRLRAPEPAPAPAAPTTRDCPYCLSSIPLAASRCGHCTSQLSAS